jgi:phosphoglycerate dehydrogenase-like enzyme
MTPFHARLRIAVLDDFQNVARQLGDWSRLPDAEVRSFTDHLDDEDALAARLQPFDVVCLMRERTPMPATLLARLPRLRLIVTTGMWNASLDILYTVAHGIPVCGTTAIESGTPELTWLLMLALARRLPMEQAAMAAGDWQTGLGGDLEDRTVGIIGFGNIGERIARVALAFDMKVLAWSENLTASRAEAGGATFVPKDVLLRESDFVTIHMKLSTRTRHLIGSRELAMMKKSAFLINTSRGPIVNEEALINALRGERIAGAGLDVFQTEPLPPAHPLRTMPNVIATPHIGYVTARGYEHFYAEIVENIVAWNKGHPVRLLGGDSKPLIVN